MLRNAWRFSLCAACICVLCSAGRGYAADSGSGPSISEMEVAVGVGAQKQPSERTGPLEETKAAVEEAQAKLKEGDAYGAKAVLMRLEKFHTLGDADYALLEPVARKVDEALGEAREKIEAQIASQLEQEAEAEKRWKEFRTNMLLKQEVDRRTSQALTEQAKVELYTENHPEKAATLARQALALNPQNEEADRVLTEAMAQMGDRAAVAKLFADRLKLRGEVMLDSLKQEFAATKKKAADLYAQGKFQEALEAWRRAETYVQVLSVYTDVQAEAEEVRRQVELAEKAAEQQRRLQEQRRAEEARQKMEAALQRIEQEATEKEAEQVDRIYKLILNHRYTEADKLIKELKYQNPGSEAAQVLDELLTHERHDFEMREKVWRTEKEQAALIQKVYEQAIPYARLVDYPDKRVWKDIISVRSGVGYPSRLKKYTEEELKVLGQLDMNVTLAFDETPLPQVIEFLQNVTPVNYVLQRQDLPPDLAPITLHIETTLRNALDMICNLAGLGWKVEGSVVRIANPERLKEYELRVYDIRDLLLNTEDRYYSGGRRYGRRRERDYGDYDYDYGDYGRDYDYGDYGRDYGRDYGYEGRGDRYGGRYEYGEDIMDRADALRQLIMETVRPETWEAGGAIGGERRRREERGYEEGAGIWETQRTQPAAGFGAEFGQAAVSPTQPRGRAFFRGGNPGDLIIIQTPEVHAEIEELLRQLRLAMYILVNVEARYIEVTADFFKEVGFGFPLIETNPEAAEGESNTTISIGTGIAEGAALFGETAGAGLDIALSIFDGTALQGFFRAVQTHRGARTVAAPTVTLVNGQRGYLSVETEQAYVASWETAEEQFEPEVDMIAETMALDVRPIVSADRRYVFLELAPYRTGTPTLRRFEWTTVEPAAEEGGEPATATNYIQLPEQLIQEFEVTVCVPDRGILMVGGLTNYTRDDVERGVPLLNKIPVIKRLFMGEGLKISRRTLLVLVRPRIILLPEEEELTF